MSQEKITYFKAATEVQRKQVAQWMVEHEHPGVADRVLRGGGDVIVAIKDERIIGAAEIQRAPIMHLCFEKEGTVFQTNRVFESIRNGLQMFGIRPLVAIRPDSKTHEFAARVMTKVEAEFYSF